MQQQLQIGDFEYGPRAKVYWAEVVSGQSDFRLEYFRTKGRNVPQAEVCLGLKWSLGQTWC